MIGGKVSSQHKPTALGSLLQSSTYGMTIPTIYGTTQSNLLAIWAQHLRQGKCRGKKYKGKKKGTPNYIENIDFLIGSNPIEGVLQTYLNGGKYSLNFIDYEFSPPFNTFSWTVPDSNFYFLIALTAEIVNSGAFADYGSPNYGQFITGMAVQNLGSGYAIGDVIQIDGGTTAAELSVTAVTSTGAIMGFVAIAQGSGYTTDVGLAHHTTTALTGSGSGLTMKMYLNNSSGGISGGYFYDTSEYPMWNAWQHGPDLVDAGYAKYYPFIYQWTPAASNATFGFPFAQTFMGGNQGLPGGNGNFHAYYAQLSSEAEYLAPITAACLTFESTLGNGPEYSSFSSQQILYPEYAGAGSADIDLGASGMIPQISVETKGTFARWYPRGDADYADMIEDTVKSGMIQTGAELGLIQRGVNCNELPGAVDKAQYYNLEPFGTSPTVIQQPISAGQMLLCFCRWRYGSGGLGSGSPAPTISDDAGNTWTPVFDLNTGMYGGFWYAIAAADYPAGDSIKAVANNSGGGFAYDIRAYAWVMDPGSEVLDGSAVTASGTSAGAVTSITTTGPAFLIVVLDIEGSSTQAGNALPLHWNNLFPNMQNDASVVAYRIVNNPGTYTFSSTALALSPFWQIGMVALKTSQPSGSVPYPKALGNILDKSTLDVVRAQDQANGLFGSVTMNAQKPASDWLDSFYKCADAAPVWSGFVLKSVAYSETSYVGNGRIFVSPTASGPAATFSESNLIAQSEGAVVTIERKAQVDSNNIVQAQYFDRDSDYAPSNASEPLSAAIALFGPRKESPMDLPMIQSPTVARKILNIEVNKYNMLRNKSSFSGMANLLLYEAMDLIEINDSQVGLSNKPVRLTKVEETDTYELQFEAEPFVYGCHAPNQLIAATVAAPYSPASATTADPGSVNTPIFIEVVPRLAGQSNQAQLWIPVSAPSADYGGCAVLISTDGGASYVQPKDINGNAAAIQGSAVTGITVGDWPAANDPDTANDLSVDLTESLGTLETYAAADRDNFTYPCYVAVGTTCIPYELMAYDIATLTASYKYTLPATGGGSNELRRGVFGAPGPTVGIGVDHPGGSRFCFIGNAAAPVGIVRLAMDPSWIGKTLYFKFLAFNTFGNNIQNQSTATAYSYTPSGCAAGLAGGNGGSTNPNNNNYTVSDLITQPTATDIHVSGPGGGSTLIVVNFPSNSATYAAQDFTISAPSTPTTYYLTVYDPAQLGDQPGSPAPKYCENSTAKVGVPGYTYLGAVQAVSGGGGTQSSGGGSVATQTQQITFAV